MFHIQVVDRTRRHAENGFVWLNATHHMSGCVGWEQAMFNDVWPSLVLGTPVSHGIARLWCMSSARRSELLKDKAFADRDKAFEQEVSRLPIPGPGLD